MKLQKLILPVALVLFSTACALPSIGDISGPTVEAPIPVSGSVLLEDDFSNPASGFERFSTTEAAGDYDNGVYRFLINGAPLHYFSRLNKRFTDTRIEVDAAKLDGPDSNLAGIICRFNNVNGIPSFYFMAISSDGYYAIGLSNDKGTVLLGQDQMGNSPNINTGVSINHLRADCVGSMLTFYVNGFPIAQATDTTLASGEVGLLAGAVDAGGVDIIFDRFIVIQP